MSQGFALLSNHPFMANDGLGEAIPNVNECSINIMRTKHSTMAWYVPSATLTSLPI